MVAKPLMMPDDIMAAPWYSGASAEAYSAAGNQDINGKQAFRHRLISNAVQIREPRKTEAGSCFFEACYCKPFFQHFDI
ncbi:Uncharacterised protein [Mycobacteroides abscessus subsp. abscessus]|nr:Uncharacterised protein [Mycobacteroides abscessus subsp. abscessus]